MINLTDILYLSESTLPLTQLSSGEENIINQLERALTTSGSNLKSALQSATENAAGGRILPNAQIARRIYLQHRQKLNAIIGSSPEEFYYLGGGSWGWAFRVAGNKVLKMEESRPGKSFSAEDRTEMSVKSLWKTEKRPSSSKLGRTVPMVYDHGIISIFGRDIFWSIMESMETGDKGEDKNKPSFGATGIQKWYNLIDLILDEIREPLRYAYAKAKVVGKPLTQEELKQLIKKIYDYAKGKIENLTVDLHVEENKTETFDVKDMELDLRLVKDWFNRLVSDMVYLLNESIVKGSFDTDFHPGNLGIRRLGSSEGYFVYFD